MTALSREVVEIFGKSQSGKSALLNDLLYQRGNERSIIYDFKNEIDATLRTNDLQKLYRTCKDGVFFRVVVSDPFVFPALCAMVNTMKGVTFAIDEIQTVVQNRKAMNEALMQLIFAGTKQRINMYMTTQRPMKMHADLRSQFTKLIVFNQSEPQDLKWVSEAAGDHMLFQEVQRLKPHHYITVTWDGVTGRGVTTPPRKGRK